MLPIYPKLDVGSDKNGDLIATWWQTKGLTGKGLKGFVIEISFIGQTSQT